MANLQIITNWTASADGSYRSSNPAGDYVPEGITELFSENFNSYTVPGEIGFGAQDGGVVEQIATGGHDGGGYIRGTYPIPDVNGNTYIYTLGAGDLNVVPSMTNADNELWVTMWVRMEGEKHGFKLAKFFGQKTGSDAAGTTFQPNYATGILETILFGDGTSVGNDAQNVIRLDGTTSAGDIGRSWGLPGFSINTPANDFIFTTGWHKMQMRVKFNSGDSAINETNDGIVQLYIDDVLYVDVQGLYNRHWSNLPMDHLGLFGHSQASSSGPWTFDYSYVSMSKGGFV